METKYLCKFIIGGGYLIDATVGKRVGDKYNATRFDTKDDLMYAVERYMKSRRTTQFDEVSFTVIEIHTFPAIPNPDKQW